MGLDITVMERRDVRCPHAREQGGHQCRLVVR